MWHDDMKPSSLTQGGPRSEYWFRARPRIIRDLAERGIKSCELNFAGCRYDSSGGLAHAVKRRFISKRAEAGSPEHIATVVVSCLVCHSILDETMSHAQMREAVMAAIKRRGT